MATAKEKTPTPPIEPTAFTAEAGTPNADGSLPSETLPQGVEEEGETHKKKVYTLDEVKDALTTVIEYTKDSNIQFQSQVLTRFDEALSYLSRQ